MIINQPGATFTYGGVEYVIGAPVIGTKERPANKSQVEISDF